MDRTIRIIVKLRGGEAMRARASIMEGHRAEASRIRERIAELERLLIARASSKGSRDIHEIGHDIRVHKAHLLRLEECLRSAHSYVGHAAASRQ